MFRSLLLACFVLAASLAQAAPPPFDDSALAPPGYAATCALPNLAVYNVVTGYGAKGDGVADDTRAIRAALAAAVANKGGVIYLPTGTYLVCPQPGDPIPKPAAATVTTPFGDIFHLTSSNLTFIGDGPAKTIIKGRCFGLTDPLTNWVVTGDPNNYIKIGRFTVFGIFSTTGTGPISNIAFRSLTIDGGAGFTGNFAVGGDPTTGDGWDMRHNGIRVSGPVALDNILMLNCDLKNFRGEVVWAGGQFVQRLFVLGSKVHGSNASAVSCSADIVVNSTQIGGPVAGDDVYNGVENYANVAGAVGVGQQTVIENNCLIQASSGKPRGNGGGYIGPKEASLTVTDSTFTGNASAILFSEQAYNVTVAGNKFTNNSNVSISSILNLYPQMAYRGFGNMVFESNTLTSSGCLLISQAGNIQNLLLVGNSIGTGSQLLSGSFAPATGAPPSIFVVARNSFAAGSKDVTSGFSGPRAFWRGNTRPMISAGAVPTTAFNKYDAFALVPAFTIMPATDLVYLNSNKALAGTFQPITIDPVVLAAIPDGFQFTILCANPRWSLKADPTQNTLTADYPLAPTGTRITVSGSKVYVNK